MNSKDQIRFILLGFSIWMVGTVAYRIVGTYCFEGSVIQYWLTVILTAILCAVASLGLMKWRRIEQKDWLQAAICLALPGMLGEVPVLACFSDLMSNMQLETAGRYAAFLFSGYAALISSAWLMSTRVRLMSVSERSASGLL